MKKNRQLKKQIYYTKKKVKLLTPKKIVMKTKVTIKVELDEEESIFFERLDTVDYNDIMDLLNEATIRAEEYISRKRKDEIDN